MAPDLCAERARVELRPYGPPEHSGGVDVSANNLLVVLGKIRVCNELSRAIDESACGAAVLAAASRIKFFGSIFPGVLNAVAGCLRNVLDETPRRENDKFCLRRVPPSPSKKKHLGVGL